MTTQLDLLNPSGPDSSPDLAQAEPVGQVAEVLVTVHGSQQGNGVFSYRVPGFLEQVLVVGLPVLVPFGKGQQVGYVTALRGPSPDDPPLKSVAASLSDTNTPLFDANYRDWIFEVSQYYGVAPLVVLETALPARMVSQGRWMVEQLVVNPKLDNVVLTGDLARCWEYIDATASQVVSLRGLARKLTLKLGRCKQLVQRLARLGWVRLHYETTQAMAVPTRTVITALDAQQADGLSKRQRAVFDQLAALPEGLAMGLIDAAQAAKTVGTTPATLRKLAGTGAITLKECPAWRDMAWLSRQFPDAPVNRPPDSDRSPVTLSESQQAAVTRLLQAKPDPIQAGQASVQAGQASVQVCYGVTGSGKTEVYMALAQASLARGESVLILVPEISLTAHLARRVINRFGLSSVCIWHSQMSEGERVDAWHRLQSGQATVAIGARSAVFLPMQRLGLVVIDEAHESSFKQDQPDPRYDARVLAEQRARQRGALVVLGSATPAVTQYHRGLAEGHVVTLSQRFGQRALAQVHVVPNQLHRPLLPGGVIRPPLHEAILANLANRQQTMLCLNRRGFYTLVECQTCGHLAQCPQCDVAVTVHKALDVVRCHYCGWQAKAPTNCRDCASDNLSFGGLGTQRLENELGKLYPSARILRLDGDAMQHRDAHQRIIGAFERGEADILVGTQMIAKGLDIPNTTLVGVIGIDRMLGLPDYVSEERTFQMLTQVAGRAGRGDLPGLVIIQTTQPEHPVIRRAAGQDFLGFYEDELARRKLFAFPPFSQLFRWVVSSQEEAQAHAFMQTLALGLRHRLEREGIDPQAVRLLGPSPCAVGRVRGYYRLHLLVKNMLGQPGHDLMTDYYRTITPSDGVRCLLDVDALNLL
ncbi:MAG: primosomal protein N' [Cyanobacteria bacterium HKST-UBA04]|nr:primosomal protein N' [Cyanobacteria bacterium HKST-UBA04]